MRALRHRAIRMRRFQGGGEAGGWVHPVFRKSVVGEIGPDRFGGSGFCPPMMMPPGGSSVAGLKGSYNGGPVRVVLG